MHLKLVLLSFFALGIIQSCGNAKLKNENQQLSNQDIYSKSFQDKLIEANKMYVEKESSEIEQYIANHNLKMTSTGTGLRYMISERGNGAAAVIDKQARINFNVSLLDGTLCYSSDSIGPKVFVIGMDNMESGLHEGIQLLHVGDKAKFILPSHLAHGLLGDEIKIPPHSTIVYDIELLDIH